MMTREQEWQQEFDLTVGRLDRVLSLLINYARHSQEDCDDPNKQTLKHHAEDMVAAGEKILKLLANVEGTPQPQ
jgi:hypothetical protein